MLNIKENIYNIKENIKEVCYKINRNPEDIKIIAVTKTVDVDRIKFAIDCGVSSIGENKVQEILEKYDKIDKSIEWHMIGHLQTNKVKYIIDKVDMIHSLDSIKLAKEIEKRAAKISREIDVLIQINVANEESKFGIHPDDVYEFIDEMVRFKYIKVKGLMTIAPYAENPEEVRKYFKEMKSIFEQVNMKYCENYENIEMKYLSMGMTNDYLVAIEEGANIVRIGTGIFGKRNYNK
ncbi:hypothetical protein SAMN02745883_00233 [Caminicella sporogenes DSM 14501]|uniref:Pyridoxal phosphate homeostasis protein n=1 Tax=Caminicella sporogenes DSM 14501 TaxID=1121266 RepID=A0A1M6LJQ3_9FIRM|nr:YggS family pyridoxal phosphate-dependent enzyme [Caminicella sporogenes]RKD27854.1 YggS family pyridoxal phosphate enzyme [Caminicella sporogenes]SHJ71434.1 hypothetical protein SAMN02745883_00233 [Caminicella sporogenes DSM 14501]